MTATPDRRSGVAALLDRHRAADPREQGFVDAMRALLDAPGDPFGRSRFEPGHFTASAFVTAPDGGSVLLVHHGKLHRWLQPGGHFEPDDVDLFAAVRREIAEETGIVDVSLPDGAALLDVDIHEIPPLKGDPAHRHYDLRVHLRAATLAFTAGSDARAAKWVALDAVREAESDPSVMRAITRLIRARARTGT
ncbi:MAG: NUDIX hydrolase [Myxococcota bacterium]